jgi:hypothetical protein
VRRVGLGGLETVDAEGSADVHEAVVEVDVALLERDPFAGRRPVAAANTTIGP